MDDYRNQMSMRGIPLGEKYIQLSYTFVEDVITMWSRKFDKSSDLLLWMSQDHQIYLVVIISIIQTHRYFTVKFVLLEKKRIPY